MDKDKAAAVWVAQEQGHGRVLAEVIELLGGGFAAPAGYRRR